MLKKIKLSLVAIVATLAFAVSALVVAGVAMPAVAGAQSCDTTSPSGANICNSLCSGANLSTTQSDCATTTGDAGTNVNNIIKTVINIFSLVVGVVAVIMIIIGGFRYITSGGDSGNVSGAKNTILFAIVGLVIVALAQIIVKFVLGKITQPS